MTQENNKVNTVGKDAFEVDRAYTAGFLDADGSIMATIERHSEKRFGFRIRVAVKVTQKEEHTLEWFLKRYKIGSIRSNRTTYDWLVRDQGDVLHFLQAIAPYVKSKRKQLQYALQVLEMNINSQEDLVEAARLADALSRFNVRSKNRRKNYVAMIEEAFSRNDSV